MSTATSIIGRNINRYVRLVYGGEPGAVYRYPVAYQMFDDDVLIDTIPISEYEANQRDMAEYINNFLSYEAV